MNKHQKYMAWTIEGAELFSTCSKRKYMTLILDADGFVISTGYNGSSPGMPHCVDGGCPRALTGAQPGSDYGNCVSNHSEANALIRAPSSMRGGTLYVNGTPCYTCGKLIANSGVRRVVYLSDREYVDFDKTLGLLEAVGIETIDLKGME